MPDVHSQVLRSHIQIFLVYQDYPARSDYYTSLYSSLVRWSLVCYMPLRLLITYHLRFHLRSYQWYSLKLVRSASHLLCLSVIHVLHETENYGQMFLQDILYWSNFQMRLGWWNLLHSSSWLRELRIHVSLTYSLHLPSYKLQYFLSHPILSFFLLTWSFSYISSKRPCLS